MRFRLAIRAACDTATVDCLQKLDEILLFKLAASLHVSQRSSREAGKGCGYEARAEKHPQAYCQYVEDVFQA